MTIHVGGPGGWRELKSKEEVNAFFDACRARRKEQDRLATKEQKALGEGDCYRTLIAKDDLTEIWGYGIILPLEYEEDRQKMKETPNLRMVRAWSALCPEGEMGLAHVQEMTPISAEEFAAFRQGLG